MSFIPRQLKKVREQITVKLEAELLGTLDSYARFIESSRDYIIAPHSNSCSGRTGISPNGIRRIRRWREAAEGRTSMAGPTWMGELLQTCALTQTGALRELLRHRTG